MPTNENEVDKGTQYSIVAPRTDVHWFPARTSERSTYNRQVIFNLFLFIVTFSVYK